MPNVHRPACATCGGYTDAMFSTNDGVFCERHVKAALIQQDIAMGLEALAARMDRDREALSRFPVPYSS